MGVLSAGVAFTKHLMTADFLSVELASRFNVDEDEVRQYLVTILARGRVPRVLLVTSPYVLLAIIITIGLLANRKLTIGGAKSKNVSNTLQNPSVK
jgi:hypothetical protein